jgi:hypothetical protein
MPFSGNFICNSFKLDLLLGRHNFGAGGHNFKLALYTSAATLNASTTSYTGTTNEVAPSGSYTTGGGLLVLLSVPALINGVAALRWQPISFTASTITARGALIYNDSLPGKNAVVVLDFGTDRSSVNSDFTIPFPSVLPDPSNAIIRIL